MISGRRFRLIKFCIFCRFIRHYVAYLLFTLYFVLLSWLITKSAFIHKTGISKSGLIALFTVKLLSGVLYGYLYSRPGFIQGADTWQIYFESVKETKILLGDPIRFLASLFANPDQLSFTGFSESDHSYWNNLKDNLLIKAEAVMNLFSGGYYYTNVVIYSFITFYGSITFYRTLNELYSGRKISKIIAAFLLPSFLFWTSGFYKDGVLFLFISLIIYHSNRWIMERNGGWKRFSIVMTSVIIIFLLRNYVAFLLIPALSGWLISATFKRYLCFCNHLPATDTICYYIRPLTFFIEYSADHCILANGLSEIAGKVSNTC